MLNVTRKVKKVIVLILVLAVSFSLVACGGAKSKSEKPEKGEVKKGKVATEAYFKDNVAETKECKIEITDVKIIQPGEAGNEYGEKPVIAFWYKVTNKTDEELDPLSAWAYTFTAYQDNDPDRVNELDAGMLPDDRFRDTQFEDIKKNGTVECAVSYELDDLETPVLLKATSEIGGKEIGSKEYSIK